MTTTIKTCLCGLVFGHRYRVDLVFSSHSRRLCCARCGAMFAMNDDTKSLIPWDEDFERLVAELYPDVMGKLLA